MKVDRRLALSVSLSVNINLKTVKFPSSFWNTEFPHTMHLCVRVIITINSVVLLALLTRRTVLGAVQTDSL